MPQVEKRLSIEELVKIVDAFKREGKKIVHCHGCFDLMHPGHIKHFQSAKKMGDILIVTVTPDKYVDKGPHRPVFKDLLRSESIAALSFVDFVAISRWPTAIELIGLLKPDYYVKGQEFGEEDNPVDPTGKLEKEKQTLDEYGGKLMFTRDQVFSSSNLINNFFDIFPKGLKEKLAKIKQEYTLDDIISVLDRIRDMKILIIGDVIIDTYEYCIPMERASKTNIVSTRYVKTEKGAGGSLCIANHLSEFCDHVSTLEALGSRKSFDDVISASLPASIDRKTVFIPGCETIEKKRYLDFEFKRKMFEIQNNIFINLLPEHEEKLIEQIENINDYDLVIMADFGHGAVSRRIYEFIKQNQPFYAGTIQTNSANFGFSYFSKYENLDFLVIDERELRLGLHEKDKKIEDLIDSYQLLKQYNKISITCGRKGSKFFREKMIPIAMPIVNETVVDPIGAGDAFLAMTAPLACLNVDPKLILLLGNMAGSMAANIVGNNERITKQSFIKFLTSIYK